MEMIGDIEMTREDFKRAAEYAAKKVDRRGANDRRLDDLNLKACFLVVAGARDGWLPFSEDTPEAVEAWAEGRRFCRMLGPHPQVRGEAQSPPGQPPGAKQLGLYLDNQNLRVEWEVGWDYEHVISGASDGK